MVALAPTPAGSTRTSGRDDEGVLGTDDVWAWNAARLEFDRLRARRTDVDTWEIVDVSPDRRVAAGSPAALDPGDVVRCELSDGELLVHDRLWRGRLL